jgi:thiol-disulfide isomerase/thioredoxin
VRRIAALLLATALLLSGAACTRATAAKPDRTLAGDLVGGGRYDPASHRGKVTVVNFWGSWCAPCRAETPELVAAYTDLRADDVAFLGINVRDPDRDKAVAFVEAYKVPYPSIYDPPGRLALAFDVPPSTIPTTLILNRDGSVATQYRQGMLRDQLTAAVRDVVAGHG